MENILNQQIATSFANNTAAPSLYSRFIHWCEGQEKYRFGWLAAALSVHGCALTPITLFAVILAGTNIVFFVIALIAMGMALVTNLAAMPTKVTIPVFFASIVIDLVLIISCAAIGFDIAGTYI